MLKSGMYAVYLIDPTVSDGFCSAMGQDLCCYDQQVNICWLSPVYFAD